MIRILSILTILALIFPSAGCSLTYILHAASGQLHLLNNSIPVEEALKSGSLNRDQKNHLRLVARIKEFGETELGLKKTGNYQTVYLKSGQRPVYTVSASPKDRLSSITWWFPVVGKMPYIGFFDLKKARAEKRRLIKKDLDVIISAADAYSTLGWFRDPVTLNLLEGSTVELVETILHEMTHTTLYVKGQGAFNEGLAVLIGKTGARLFLEKEYGLSNPLTVEAENSIKDERIFSSYLATLLEQLERLYSSPATYREKLEKREKIFSGSINEFSRIRAQFKTDNFRNFGGKGLNNAYLMAIGLYHRHFNLFKAVLEKNGDSIMQMLAFLQGLSRDKGDIIEKMGEWLGGCPGMAS